MIETLESITLFIDITVFFQNDASVVVLPHHSKDVLFHDLESSLFRSFLQAGKQIICPTLQAVQASLITTVHIQADVEVAD